PRAAAAIIGCDLRTAKSPLHPDYPGSLPLPLLALLDWIRSRFHGAAIFPFPDPLQPALEQRSEPRKIPPDRPLNANHRPPCLAQLHWNPSALPAPAQADLPPSW